MTAKWFVRFCPVPENSGKLPRGYLKRHNATRERFWTVQAGSCPTLSPAGEFLLLISLLTFLSTNVQSLERSIKGSTKLGQVKIGQGCLLRYSLPDSLYCLFSGCLTYLQCIMGIKDHHGQQTTCLLSNLCKLASRHQATSNSHSRQKISLKNKFHKSCFCGISWLVQ